MLHWTVELNKVRSKDLYECALAIGANVIKNSDIENLPVPFSLITSESYEELLFLLYGFGKQEPSHPQIFYPSGPFVPE